jgi:hypothetical protein
MFKHNNEIWFTHDGSEHCPVNRDEVISVLLRNGQKISQRKAGILRWTHNHPNCNTEFDIIGYKLWRNDHFEPSEMTMKEEATTTKLDKPSIAATF